MLDLNGIKNIIFDLGGVIINLDYDLTPKAFQKLGVNNFEQLYSKASQKSLFDDFEKGFITANEFRNEIKIMSGLHLTDEQIDHAWNAMLLDLPVERLNLLKKVQQKYRTFLLSNTNEIHMNSIYKYMQNSFGVNSLDPYFEKVFLSYQIGKRKPDTLCFEWVLSQMNLLPEQTVFIDDSIQHIQGALKTGIKAYHLSNSLTISNLFEQPN